MKALLGILCAGVLAIPGTARAQPGAGRTAAQPAVVTAIPLPGGLAALLREARLPGPADPAIAVPAIVRALYLTRGTPPAPLARYFDSLVRAGAGPGQPDLVPLPLTPELWAAAVLHRKVPSDRLAPAILADRRASLVYHGLISLDDETLRYLSGRPALVGVIAEQAPGVFAEWGRSIHVANGRIQLPGGDEAAPLWAAVAGHAPADVEGFLRALFGREGGRAAFLYDAVAHLDPPRQAFALGAALGAARTSRFKDLYAGFQKSPAIDFTSGWPVSRDLASPRTALQVVDVTSGGRMAPPAGRALWEAAFSGDAKACPAPGDQDVEADAAWLTERVERAAAAKRRDVLAVLAFGQRVFGRASPGGREVCETLAAYERDQALILALERIGLDDPHDYAAAVRFAAGLSTDPDRQSAVAATAQVQAVLLLLGQSVAARTVETGTARRMVLSLLALGGTESGSPPPGAVAGWMRRTLLPALCSGQPSPDDCLVRAVSGAGPGSGAPEVAWEGQRYRIDLGAASAARIQRIRQLQRATTIADALGVGAASGDVSRGDRLLADALVSLAYAVSIGDPDEGVLMGGDPSRQHRFEGAAGGSETAWRLPREVSLPDGTWAIEGSIIGLHTVFARSWLRRLSMQDPGRHPMVDPEDVSAFGETAALFNAFDLTDAGRDRIAGAIERGRDRVAALMKEPPGLWGVAARHGIAEWRCRAAAWAPERAAEILSLQELASLGSEGHEPALLDAWGVSSRPLDGRMGIRMPPALAWEDVQGPRALGLLASHVADIHLRVAQMLAALRLPATLAPPVASYVVWDVLTSAQMAHPDDWLALVRAARRLPDDRTFDYVSALTATGPLVPLQGANSSSIQGPSQAARLGVHSFSSPPSKPCARSSSNRRPCSTSSEISRSRASCPASPRS